VAGKQRQDAKAPDRKDRSANPPIELYTFLELGWPWDWEAEATVGVELCSVSLVLSAK